LCTAEVSNVEIGKMKAALAALTLLFVVTGQASAQYPDQIGAGVSMLERNGSATGFTVDYAHSIVPFTNGPLGVVGEFGLHRADGSTLTSYLGGVRWRWDVSRRIAPFGQFLAGAEHCCGSANVTLQPGFGFEIVATPQLRFHLQVDFRDVWLEGDDLDGKRYTFGVVLPILTGR